MNARASRAVTHCADTPGGEVRITVLGPLTDADRTKLDRLALNLDARKHGRPEVDDDGQEIPARHFRTHRIDTPSGPAVWESPEEPTDADRDLVIGMMGVIHAHETAARHLRAVPDPE